MLYIAGRRIHIYCADSVCFNIVVWFWRLSKAIPATSVAPGGSVHTMATADVVVLNDIFFDNIRTPMRNTHDGKQHRTPVRKTLVLQ